MAAIAPATCVFLPISPGEQKKTVSILTPAAASADTLNLTLAPFNFIAANIHKVIAFDITTAGATGQIPVVWNNVTGVATIDPAGALAATQFYLEVSGNLQ